MMIFTKVLYYLTLHSSEPGLILLCCHKIQSWGGQCTRALTHPFESSHFWSGLNNFHEANRSSLILKGVKHGGTSIIICGDNCCLTWTEIIGCNVSSHYILRACSIICLWRRKYKISIQCLLVVLLLYLCLVLIIRRIIIEEGTTSLLKIDWWSCLYLLRHVMLKILTLYSWDLPLISLMLSARLSLFKLFLKEKLLKQLLFSDQIFVMIIILMNILKQDALSTIYYRHPIVSNHIWVVLLVYWALFLFLYGPS